MRTTRLDEAPFVEVATEDGTAKAGTSYESLREVVQFNRRRADAQPTHEACRSRTTTAGTRRPASGCALDRARPATSRRGRCARAEVVIIDDDMFPAPLPADATGADFLRAPRAAAGELPRRPLVLARWLPRAPVHQHVRRPDPAARACEHVIPQTTAPT